VTRVVVFGPSSELLIGRHQRGSDVVGQKYCLAVHMQKLDDVFITDNTTSSGFWESFCGDDLPDVVCIVVCVSSYLLACSLVSTSPT
jgi:hypothetical protein